MERAGPAEHDEGRAGLRAQGEDALSLSYCERNMSETPLEMARRHVAESEARCAQQTEILREMIADDHPHAAKVAKRLLATLEDTLDLMRERLRIEETRATGGVP